REHLQDAVRRVRLAAERSDRRRAGVRLDMDLHLTDKVAVISGSSKGLGFAAARALLDEGARVAISGRTKTALDAAAAALASDGGAGRVLAVQADVSTPAGAGSLVARTLERFGRIDVLVNNVGKAGGGDIVSTGDDEWQSAIDQTLFPAIRLSRLVVPH